MADMRHDDVRTGDFLNDDIGVLRHEFPRARGPAGTAAAGQARQAVARREQLHGDMRRGVRAFTGDMGTNVDAVGDGRPGQADGHSGGCSLFAWPEESSHA